MLMTLSSLELSKSYFKNNFNFNDVEVGTFRITNLRIDFHYLKLFHLHKPGKTRTELNTRRQRLASLVDNRQQMTAAHLH